MPASGRRRAGSRSSGGGGRRRTGRGSWLLASAWRWRAAAVPRTALEVGLRHAGELARGGDPDAVEPDGGRRADPPDPLDREWVKEGELVPGRDEEEPVGLGDCAGDLARCFVRAMPTVSGQAQALPGGAAEADGDLPGCAGDPLHAPDVEEGFVDREPFDRRRRVLEEGEERTARLRVSGHPRRERRARAGRVVWPAFRPSPFGRRTPLPRSWRRARHRRRRSPAVRASGGRRAARQKRRKHRRRHAGSSLRRRHEHDACTPNICSLGLEPVQLVLDGRLISRAPEGGSRTARRLTRAARYGRGARRLTTRTIPAVAAAAAAPASVKRFVVAQVRQTPQHAWAAGASSTDRLTSGRVRSFACSSTAERITRRGEHLARAQPGARFG